MKYILFIIIPLSFSFGASAQTLKQIADAKKQEEFAKVSHKVTPPIAVRAAFAKDHPGKNVTWQKERGHFEASYEDNGKNMSQLYGEAGHKIESEEILQRNQMPAIVIEYIEAHYKGQKITEYSIIKKSNAEENYEVELGNTHVLFNKAGKYIKTLQD